MNVLPLAANEVVTADATITTIVELPLLTGHQGLLTVEVSGENVIDQTECYGYVNRVTVSCEAGAATVQATGVAVELDPAAIAPTITVDASGTSIRVRVEGPAADWKWVAKITGILHWRVPSGAVAVFDPAVAALQTPYQDFAYTGAELIVDGDMEAAGVANWPTGAGATDAKDTTAPLYEGTQHLRVTDAGSTGYAYQTPYVADQRYVAKGYMRATGGGETARFEVDGSFLISIVAVAWTEALQTNFHCPTSLQLRLGKGSTGNSVDADAVSSWRVPIVTQSDSLITLANPTPLYQDGAASARPTYLNDAAAAAQGITGACHQYSRVNATAGQYFKSRFAPPADFTAGGWFRLTDVTPAFQTLLGATESGVAYCEMSLGGTQLRAYVGTVASLLAHGTAVTANAWHHIVVGGSGTTIKLWLNGVPASNALGLAHCQWPWAVMARGTSPTGATYYFPAAGYTGQLGFFNRLLTDAEVLSWMYSTYRS